jgi:hypothetical protein
MFDVRCSMFDVGRFQLVQGFNARTFPYSFLNRRILSPGEREGVGTPSASLLTSCASSARRCGAEYGCEVRGEKGVRRRFPLLGERVRVRGSGEGIAIGRARVCAECIGGMEEENESRNCQGAFALTPALSMNPSKHPTSNIQHPTPNKRPNRDHSMFDVRCSM